MTAARASAYGHVATLLRELGPAKLTPSEQQRIRDSADTLLFAASLLSDERAQDAVRDFGARPPSRRHGQMSSRRAGRLLDAVCACGPAALEAA